jgi:uncharacterized protein DUF6933
MRAIVDSLEKLENFFSWSAGGSGDSTATPLHANRLERADYPLYSQTAEAPGAEAIIDPPSPTNRLGNWYAKLVFVRRVPLIICISERSLLPVIVEARDASSFSPRFRDAARSVLQGIGAGPDIVGREVREMGSVAIGVTANRRVLGSLNDLASLARFEIEDNPSIDFVTLAVKLAETPCSPLKYESPRTVSLALLRHATS